ncbi:MAG: D-alanine--D-alanine ligase A, partial [Chloroflexota bacterium]
PGNEFYDYAAKYIDNNSLIEIPADVTPEVMDLARQLAIDAFRALDLAGLARVDFFLDRETGELLVNEVNTMPGFTAISMYPKMWEASGLGLTELVDRLVQLALERHRERA